MGSIGFCLWRCPATRGDSNTINGPRIGSRSSGSPGACSFNAPAAFAGVVAKDTDGAMCSCASGEWTVCGAWRGGEELAESILGVRGPESMSDVR